MKPIHKAITIIGVTAVLGGLVTAGSAQPAQTSIVQSTATDLLNRGLDKAKRGDYQGAIADYTQAIRTNPNLTGAYIHRGTAHHDVGDLSRAIADFNLALRLEPNNAIARYSRGEARSDVGDLPGAIADLNQAIVLAPNFAKAYNDRSVAYA